LSEDKLIIAIDGPAGSGKSTIAKLVAEKLGILYLDSGAIYRAVTLLFLKEKLDFSNENKQIPPLLRVSKVGLRKSGNSVQVFLDDVDVTVEVRSQRVTQNVSAVSALTLVREHVTALLRKMADKQAVIMDGRDIGTVVFPDAHLKVYMEASLDVRASRRQNDNDASGLSLDALKEDIARRDSLDAGRAVAPLRKPNDAFCINTTDLTIRQVVEQVMAKVAEVK